MQQSAKETMGNPLITNTDVAPTQMAEPLAWTDTFFAGDERVVAVFDYDYDVKEDFLGQALCIPMAFPCFWPFALCSCYPCYLKSRISWDARAQHVAITTDGIRFVQDKRKTAFGCACTDAGKISKTVPFDKITDCDISEPAGATCCCITNVLTTVHVDTASSGTTQEGIVRHELVLTGLKNAHAFKKTVWDMKRSEGRSFSATGGGVQAQSMEDRGGNGGGSGEHTALLTDIRNELREQTALLRKQAGL